MIPLNNKDINCDQQEEVKNKSKKNMILTTHSNPPSQSAQGLESHESNYLQHCYM